MNNFHNSKEKSEKKGLNESIIGRKLLFLQTENEQKVKERITGIWNKLIAMWNYCSHGVWSDTRPMVKVNLIKTLNITVKSFFNTDIQTQASAMTYRTLLAIVPALALIFAIGRGFGLQNLIQDELYRILPTQKGVISHSLSFVDSYLNQASEGIFVGVGIVFLLWTLISLLSSVEDSFNLIWGVKQGRNLWRKISDYTAMFLILPILMICGSGLAIFVNDKVTAFFDLPFVSPLLSVFFELGSYIFTCLFFAAVFMLIPNTKVKFQNALISGTFTGTAFIVLQWLFVSGQLYVAKYNAIYGSFSFLPLLFIWLQLVWVICLTGSLICYASQNIFQFSFYDQINDISRVYSDKVTIAIAAVVTKNFMTDGKPVTQEQLIKDYGIPSRLVNQVSERLTDLGIFSKVLVSESHELFGYQPAMSPEKLTVSYIQSELRTTGYKDFIPGFSKNFPGVEQTVDAINSAMQEVGRDVCVGTLEISLMKAATTNTDTYLNTKTSDK